MDAGKFSKFKKVVLAILRPLDYLVEFFFPSACLVCGEPTISPRGAILLIDQPLETRICPRCQEELSTDSATFCARCGRVVRDRSLGCFCNAAGDREFYFDAISPLQFYRGVARSVVLKMKRDRSFALADAMGILYRKRRQDQLEAFRPDCVVAVPMNWRRSFARGGINAPEIVAKRLSRELRVPRYSKYLKRSRATVTQASVAMEDRVANVRDAFEILEPDSLRRRILKRALEQTLRYTRALFPWTSKTFKPHEKGIRKYIKKNLGKRPSVFKDKRILLFDDVFTTGATSNEISRILLDAGASAIMVAVLARAGLGKGKRKRRAALAEIPPEKINF